MNRFIKRKDLPASRLARIILGVMLIIGGIFWFLPVLGIWMLPLGVLVLSVDLPIVRRWRRRFEVAFGRWRDQRRAKKLANDTKNPIDPSDERD